jgi:hypothetical protein
VGSVAVFHLDDRKPRELSISLVPVLTLQGRGRTRERRGTTIDSTLVLPAGSAGSNVPFQLELPASLTPSFQTVTHGLAWWLVASSGGIFTAKVSVSLGLEILDASAAATTTRLTTAPQLGDERVAAMFAAFAAATGWRASVHDDRSDPRLAGQVAVEREAGDSELYLAYAYRGEEGTFAVSRIAHPALGLDLVVTPSSALRHVFFKDVEVDVESWDRAHHVTARFADQAIPPLRAVVPALMRAAHLGTLMRWDDDGLVFERPFAAIDEHELGRMADELAAVASAIAVASVEIAPPGGLVVDVPAWQRLATWLDGRFCVGDLSIEGTLDGAPVHVALEWTEDHQPRCVRATLGDPEAASAQTRGVAISLAHPAAEVASDPGASSIRERVAAWPADLIELQITNGVASAAYLLPAGASPVLETARVRELAEALRSVLAALDPGAPGAGPYR